MALSKAKLKYIRALELKKFRKAEGVFLAEGPKLVGDLLGHFPCQLLAATTEWLQAHPHLQAGEVVCVSTEELARASLLRTPQQVLAVFRQPEEELDFDMPIHALCLALDDVQDPGNLGTIVRLADWFGIEHLFCSHVTADVYSPKAIQATMGGIARVQVHYVNLSQFIQNITMKGCPIYGTFLDGKPLYEVPLTQNGLIVMGNEGNGISAEIERLVTDKLYIPSYPPLRETSESLNVAIATAVVCAEFRRRALEL